MATLITMAMIIIMATVIDIIMGIPMKDPVAERFRAGGWKVKREQRIGQNRADLVIRKGSMAYLVEVKHYSESRPDRVIPLLSQAILQAQAHAQADPSLRPLAVVHVPDASASLVDQVRPFANDYAPHVAIGIVGRNGGQYFSGAGLEDLSAEAPPPRLNSARSSGRLPHLFSDLNQWMLKVLLAPAIPERLLSAPRQQYLNASELAAAAKVSIMSAFRLVQSLRAEGYLHESSRSLQLVRRADLFHRWQSEAQRSAPRELPMAFLIRGDVDQQVRHQAASGGACLALFAAADALKIGHVSGVPRYVYVRKLGIFDPKAWSALPAPSQQECDFIVRQAPAPESVFRGAVRSGDVAVCDVLQVWLDVSAHPSRGEEQADMIRRRFLGDVIQGVAG